MFNLPRVAFSAMDLIKKAIALEEAHKFKEAFSTYLLALDAHYRPFGEDIEYCFTEFCSENISMLLDKIHELRKTLKTPVDYSELAKKIHTNKLFELVEIQYRRHASYGFIVMSSSGALLGVIQDNEQYVVKKFRCGSHFESLQMDNWQEEYFEKVTVLCNEILQSDGIYGLILACTTDLKTKLNKHGVRVFDQLSMKLQTNIVTTVEIHRGGLNGFNEALELCFNILEDVPLVCQKKLLKHYLNEVSQDSKKYCFGFDDTYEALARGDAKIIICWENFDIRLHDIEAGIERNYENEMLDTVRWLSIITQNTGVVLEVISDVFTEGYLFIKEFRGIACLLR